MVYEARGHGKGVGVQSLPGQQYRAERTLIRYAFLTLFELFDFRLKHQKIHSIILWLQLMVCTLCVNLENHCTGHLYSAAKLTFIAPCITYYRASWFYLEYCL